MGSTWKMDMDWVEIALSGQNTMAEIWLWGGTECREEKEALREDTRMHHKKKQSEQIMEQTRYNTKISKLSEPKSLTVPLLSFLHIRRKVDDLPQVDYYRRRSVDAGQRRGVDRNQHHKSLCVGPATYDWSN